MLAAVGLLGLSCQVSVLSVGEPRLTASPLDESPSVASTGDTADQAVPVGLTPPSDPGSEAGILAELRSRHTALADHELVVLARTIIAEAERHDLDPTLVMAVIHVESRGYHLAVSQVGARGLMQLMPGTGEELARKLDLPWRGPNSLFDPVLNVKLGTAYLRQLTDRYESVPTALAAYNWGPGRIDRRIRTGDEMPTIYTRKVMEAFDDRGAATDRS
jgi:hypothetical protein